MFFDIASSWVASATVPHHLYSLVLVAVLCGWFLFVGVESHADVVGFGSSGSWDVIDLAIGVVAVSDCLVVCVTLGSVSLY